MSDAEKKIEMREFDETDWYGFSGAENYEDGSEPRIAEVPVATWVFEEAKEIKEYWECSIILIADKSGVTIHGENGYYSYDETRRNAQDFLINSISLPVRVKQIEKLGFKAHNFEDSNVIVEL